MATTAVQERLALPLYFQALRTAIEPPQARKDQAQTIPDDVRNYLHDSTTFATIDPHTRLVGSYRRHTAIHGIKDIDVLVCVPYDSDGAEPEAEAVLSALFAALEGLPEALEYGGRAQGLRGQRRSINVAFDEEDFQLDVVPALLPNGIGGSLLVPDKEWQKWVASDPLGYVKALSTLNAATGDKAVPLIKLLKHWRSVQMKYLRPKNYYLEALAYKHLHDGLVTVTGKGDAELFTDLLASIRDDFAADLDGEGVPEIPDPMLGHNLAFNWSRRAFETFMARVDESLGWARRALATGPDDIGDAVALWQKVFDAEYFVESRGISMREQADLMTKTGKLFVTGSGLITAARPAAERAVEVPRHRFYGDRG